MSIAAARGAIATAGLATTDVDMVMVATSTPDQPLPATAVYVAEALGLKCGAVDVNAACAGFVHALVIGASMVGAGASGACLVVGADTLSRITDFSDRGTGMLFGDGAGAVVLVPSQPAGIDAGPSRGGLGGPGLIAWDLGSDGSAVGILGVPAGGSRRPSSIETVTANEHVMRMDGREVYRRAVRAVADSVTATLARAGVVPGDVDLFIPHQANARIVDAVLPRIGIPAERTFVNIDRYGNTSAGSVPIALAEAVSAGRLRDGALLLMSGFGAGMSWATTLVRWGGFGGV
jgi:3-oxoacyl-[acyl-carrier-protein] synthase-3